MCYNAGEALLQFSVLFGVEMIMLNSTKNGQWQVNEQISCKDMAGLGFDPIFTLDFLAGSDLIEIKVNGLHVYNFKHRDTFDQANLLEVSEGMEAIHMVSINDSTQATAEVLKADDA
uniref:Galectin n=2 Tax=Globodera pallida TaxID=36090 RepID=A0A183CFK4_GLOPA